MEPESRVQMRSVFQRWKRRLGESASALSRIFLALASVAASGTTNSTRSCGARFRMTSAYTQGMGSNFPGQSPRKCGQASQVAACGSHSAGIRYWTFTVEGMVSGPGISVDQAAGDRRVSVDSAVAQEGPIAADVLNAGQIDLANEDLLFVVRSLSDDDSERIAKERSSPEFKPRPRSRVAANVAIFLAHAVHHCHIDPIGDGVPALNCAPSIMLRLAELGLLGRMPANGGGVEQYVRALQGCKPRAFGVPLIPADERTNSPGLRIERLIAKIPGCEIVLFVVEWVVGDMHLAVFAAKGSVGIDDRGGVVVDAGSTLFKEGDHEGDFQLAGDGAEALGGGARNRLGQIKQGQVFALTEVLGLEKFRQADHLRALFGRLANMRDGRLHVFFWVGRAGHLNQANTECLGWQEKTSAVWNRLRIAEEEAETD